MSTNRGIFESFPNQPAARPDSPFAVVHEPAPAAAAAPAHAPAAVPSPFAAVVRQESPFTVVDEASESRQVEPGRPAKVPERRKVDSPFQVAEPLEGFGFEAPVKAYAAAPFEAPAAAPAQAPAPMQASPFSAPPQQPATSPFSAEPVRGPSPSTQAAIAAFSTWQEAPAPPAQPVFVQATPPAFTAAPAAPATQAPAAAPAPAPAGVAPQQPAAPLVTDGSNSDSFSIRQLELRAIFGVDREMNTEEIIQRSRALPGMRNIARVNTQDMGTIEALKNLLPNLGFGSGGLKLYAGAVPLEFIREGPVLLAVQTDGGFAPGVRETLMLVARELGRLS
jgi:hypothetical protein